MKYSFFVPLATLAFVSTATLSSAAFLTPSFSGSTQNDAWSQSSLTAASNPGFPTIATGASAWPSAIGSSSGGDATFNKISGEGYPTNGFGGGIYMFTVGAGAGTGGTFNILDSTAVLNLETVLFQIDLEGVGSGWQDYFTISLNYNGGSQALASTWQATSAAGPAMGGGTRQIVAFQWDLSAISAISSFEIVFHGNEHSLIYGQQLDQSDTMTQVVPEPSTWAMLFVGCGMAIWFKRRRAARALACGKE